ncbi:hypothetical protein [Kribbella sp. NPDC051770]|uniref:hypothetical protein n=1 Tax=Kribbella sp. NPDC051770 TaxID=3155413 RepID=UPI0034151E9F
MGGRWIVGLVGLALAVGGCASEGTQKAGTMAPIGGPVSRAPVSGAPPSQTPTSTPSTAPTQPVRVTPVTEVTAVGTKTAEQDDGGCDPNYSGACVPIASDVDCSSGKGNGPEYVVGPVQVVGEDIYGLDANNDGVGCENG